MPRYDEFDNVVLVPTELETVGEILNDYVQTIKYCKTDDEIEIALKMFYSELIERVEKDFHISIALSCIQRLKEIEQGVPFDEEE